uniref:Acyl-CoA thioesterase 8 n=1 Tax=Ficedula albicollis TaxID=59894 RepID=A0A803V158_FICAL
MASPGDSSGAGAGSGSEPPPSGDLRSVLITSVLNLEQLEVDLFRCAWTPEQRDRIVGQALVAAAHAVSRDEQVHSLHCYFVRTVFQPACLVLTSLLCAELQES